ncbi:MAG: hypothetical protein K9M75_11025 [Phycisphaerae bacterium]|nr:hypothetical protein [Phycisphaerae bacterium]
MNRMISFAKIMFAGFGLYLLIQTAQGILLSVMYLFQGLGSEWESLGVISLSLSLAIGIAAVVIVFLFVKGEAFARKVITKDIDEDKPVDIGLTLTMAFRLVSVGAGLFCLNSFVHTVSSILNRLMMSMQMSDGPDAYREIFRRAFTIDFIGPVLYVLLAVYLICGAPHFVKWQVKETLNLCGEKCE